ncbi:MAG: MerR family transcriptional regulator, partial [Gammaproteobacteria bacterium]|nr:MerR family transcriptional regulator [Gammaproteobacteria bacterium]
MDYRIGDVARTLDISVDTLRYYERIGLLPPVARTGGGTRLYGERDLSRPRFIQRAQKTGFSLDEVRQLLHMREDPAGARDEIRVLTRDKLDEIESRLADLTVLR